MLPCLLSVTGFNLFRGCSRSRVSCVPLNTAVKFRIADPFGVWCCFTRRCKNIILSKCFVCDCVKALSLKLWYSTIWAFTRGRVYGALDIWPSGNIVTYILNNSKCKFLYFSIHFRRPQSLYYRTFSTFSHSQKTPNLQIIGSDQIKGGGGTFFPVPPSQNPHHHAISPLAPLFDLVPWNPGSTHRSFSTFTAGTIWKV